MLGWEMVVVLVLLGLGLASFLMEKLPTDVTALSLFCGLIVLQLVTQSENLPTIKELLRVFSSPAPITIAAMFMISNALERCGFIEWVSHAFSGLTRLGYPMFILFMVLSIAFLSAFMNNTPVVVVLLPVVMSLAKPLGVHASKLLIPLSYASIFGGSCTLIGTSTNILASGIMQDHGYAPLSMFELGRLGLPLLVMGTLYLFAFGKRFLPVRETLSSILSEEERREYITEAYIKAGSPLIGQKEKDSLISSQPDVRVLEIIRDGVGITQKIAEVILEEGDRLVLSCHPTGVVHARSVKGVDFVIEKGLGLEEIASHTGNIVEAVVGPTSSIIGRSITDVNFRQHYRMVVLAIHREGKNLRNELQRVELKAGDTLLLMGTQQQIEHVRKDRDLFLLDKPPIPSENLRKRIPLVLAVIVAMVALAAFNIVPIAGGAILAVCSLLLTGCTTPKEAYASIEWGILVLIYGMLGMGMAMEKSGVSHWLAENIITGVSVWAPVAHQPQVTLSALIILTWALTEVLSNNATVLLLEPVAIQIAVALGVDPRPFMIATCIGSSATFSTPIGYQTNTYVYAVGGYRFSDFLKFGLPLNALYLLASIYLIPKLWPF